MRSLDYDPDQEKLFDFDIIVSRDFAEADDETVVDFARWLYWNYRNKTETAWLQYLDYLERGGVRA